MFSSVERGTIRSPEMRVMMSYSAKSETITCLGVQDAIAYSPVKEMTF